MHRNRFTFRAVGMGRASRERIPLDVAHFVVRLGTCSAPLDSVGFVQSGGMGHRQGLPCILPLSPLCNPGGYHRGASRSRPNAKFATVSIGRGRRRAWALRGVVLLLGVLRRVLIR